MQSTNPKDRLGKLKPQLHLIPAAANIHESMAMGDGASKYGPYNWRDKTVAASIYVGACKRHLDAWFDREENARDSGVHHLGHARACLGILLDAQSLGQMVDDRPKPGAASDLIEQFTKAKPDANRNDHENVAFHVGPVPQDVYTLVVDLPDSAEAEDTRTVAAINGSGNIEVTGDYEYDQARVLVEEDQALMAIQPEPHTTPPSKRHRLDVPKSGRRMPFEEAREYVFDKYHETFRLLAQHDTRFFDHLRGSLYSILFSFGVEKKVADQIIGGATFTPNYEPSCYDRFVYIAGPMRGYDQFNFPAFDRARDLFVYGRPGFNVISPADIDRADNPDAANQPAGDQKVYAYRDFATLLMLAYTGEGHIAMLPGWEKSTGAVAEFFLSRWLGLKILDAESTQSLNLSKIKWEDITLTTQQYLSRQLTK